MDHTLDTLTYIKPTLGQFKLEASRSEFLIVLYAMDILSESQLTKLYTEFYSA